MKLVLCHDSKDRKAQGLALQAGQAAHGDGFLQGGEQSGALYSGIYFVSLDMYIHYSILTLAGPAIRRSLASPSQKKTEIFGCCRSSRVDMIN